LLSFSFENCVLNFSSFYQLKVKKTQFKDCKLQEVEFIAADFTGSVFLNCDLTHSRFENTILERVDFRTAYNFSIDPELNKISKAKFSQSGIAGLLDKYQIEIE
jgi:fluoroquinolone resistance protein